MSEKIIISFEDDIIKVLSVKPATKGMIIKKTLTLNDRELEDYLEEEKTRDFIVVANFEAFYQDIIYLPPTKEKYLRQIIGLAIRKKIPELVDFSFTYQIIDEIIRDGRKMKEVFFYAVNNGDLLQTIDRFSRHKKTVKAFYPSAFCLSMLFKKFIETDDDVFLVVFSSGQSKTMFLLKNLQLIFVRRITAAETGMSDFDIQNINMTINHCRQSLRISPAKIVLLGDICKEFAGNETFIIPTVCMETIPAISAIRGNTADFFIPLSTALAGKQLAMSSMLPQNYKLLNIRKSIVLSGVWIFLLLSVLIGVFIGNQINTIAIVNDDIKRLREKIYQNMTLLVFLKEKSSEFRKIEPQIEYINSSSSAHNLQKILHALSVLGDKTVKKTVTTHTIQIATKGECWQVNLNGDIIADKYVEIYQNYQNLLGVLRNMKEIEIVSDRLDFKNKSFQIEVCYR